MYLLDTNVCIEIIRGRPPRVRERFHGAAHTRAELFVSCISAFELRYGAEKSDLPELNHGLVAAFLAGPLQTLAFDEEDSIRAGEIRAVLEAQGKMIGPFDTLIAGQALRRGFVLVTANTREFSRVKGLQLENWTR